MKRFVRLKEFESFCDFLVYPSESYLVNRPLLNTNRGYLKKTDCDGFLSNGIPFVNGANNIYLVGDSSVENIYCDIDKRLSFIFHKKLLNAGFDCNVFNMGVSGGTSLNFFNTIINKISVKGGQIIFFIPSNDLAALDLKGGYWNGHNYYSNIVPSSLLNLERGFFEENKGNIVLVLRLLMIFCEYFNINLHVFDIIHNGSNKAYKRISNIVDDFCKKNELSFNIIKDYPENSFYDYVHLTDTGSFYVANKLKEYMSSFIFCENKNYIEEVEFSEGVVFEKYLTNKFSLIFDIECFNGFKEYSLLVFFDFGRELTVEEMKSCSLNLSPVYKYYRYLNIPDPKKRAVLIHDFDFSSISDNLKICFKKIRNKDQFKVYSSKILIRK